MTHEVRRQMVRFWTEPDPEKARQMIVDPKRWDEELGDYEHWLFQSDLELNRFLHGKIPASAVEIGCGIGRLMKMALEKGYVSDVVGLDISLTMLAQAQEYMRETPNWGYHHLTSDHLPQLSGTVDLVYSVLCFQHIPSRASIETYVQEAYRVLKPRGYVRVQTYLGEPVPEGRFANYHGHFFRTPESFSVVFEQSGFDVKSCVVGLGHPNWVWVTGRKPA